MAAVLCRHPVVRCGCGCCASPSLTVDGSAAAVTTVCHARNSSLTLKMWSLWSWPLARASGHGLSRVEGARQRFARTETLRGHTCWALISIRNRCFAATRVCWALISGTDVSRTKTFRGHPCWALITRTDVSRPPMLGLNFRNIRFADKVICDQRSP